MMRHTPFALVVVAPSGSGKTTVIRRLVEQEKSGIWYSISATTRKPRPEEVDGYDYYFVSREQFEAWIREDALLEWAEVYGEYYGTPKAPVLEHLARGEDVILDLDIHGRRALELALPGQVVSVFLAPPDLETLRERLLHRGAEDPEKLRIRLANAERELEWAWECDYWVLNRELDEAVAQLRTVLYAERLRRGRARLPLLERRR